MAILKSGPPPALSPAEEEGLLSGQREKSPPRSLPPSYRREARTREWGLFVWALVATLASVFLAAVYLDPTADFLGWHRPDRAGPKPTGKRNIIFMVSDGMGPTSLTTTRNFVQHYTAKPGSPFGNLKPLGIDTHHIGTSRTRSSNSYVTDSAAGATAFSCGLKSYNGAIAVLDDGLPCGTVLEAAKLDGYMTGLVVTTRITDATPAAFGAHVPMRWQEDRIAEHLVGEGHPLGPTVDLMLGGGACHFMSNATTGSCRGDDRDLLSFAENNLGYKVARDTAALRSLPIPAPLPLLGLVSPTDIPYEIDRVHVNDKFPSLAEMTKIALDALAAATKDSDHGFFIMIEGSRIDHAGHENDPGAQVREVLSYDRAMAAVVEFIDKSDVPTVFVSTSDHETGGLTAARQVDPVNPEYLWYPEVLANASHSTGYAAAKITKVVSSGASSDEIRDAAKAELVASLGIHDASDDELTFLVSTAQEPPVSAAVRNVLSDMISKRAHIGWTTHGHSGVDVNIYGYPRHKLTDLHGNHENIEIGQFLARYLDVDVDAVTKILREGKHADEKDADGVPMWMSGGQGVKMTSFRRGSDHGCGHDDHYSHEATSQYQKLEEL